MATKYRFADVIVDTGRRRVSRGDQQIPLGRLTYELLVLLTERAPSVVTPEDVAECVWQGRYVARNTVKQRVKLLRDALGDDAENPRYIGVARGHGYRLIPSVDLLDDTRPSPAKRRSLVAAAGLTAIVTGFAIGLIWIRQTELPPLTAVRATETDRLQQSIAVLPFENLSTNPDDGYFVDGIHSGLLTQLSKLKSLRVISRTSVDDYRQTSKSAREIGEEIGVAAILEGNVQRSGDQLRINVQLIDAPTERSLWAELYDRKLTVENIFAIQSEITTSIAAALLATLTADDLERLERVPTNSDKAYNYYLLGESRLRRADNMVDHTQAAEAYEQAVEEDPEFAVAWAALAHAYSAMYFFVDRTDTRRKLALDALAHAFEIDPELPEAHLARGYYYYQILGDFQAALREWDQAERGLSGDPRIYMARAYAYRQMGEFREASRNLALAIDLDPRNPEYLTVQYETLCYLRDYARAESYADRLIAIAPDSSFGYRLKSQLALRRNGDGNAAREALDSGPAPFRLTHLRWTAELYRRDYEAALRVLDTWQIKTVDWRWIYRPKDWYFGVAYDLAGRPELAASHYRRARVEAENMLENRPDDPRVMIGLADIVGRQGAYARAIGLTLRALEMIPYSVPATQRYSARLNAILALIAAGDHDTALVELERFLDNPSTWSIEGLIRDPRFDPIRNDERLLTLVEKYR